MDLGELAIARRYGSRCLRTHMGGGAGQSMTVWNAAGLVVLILLSACGKKETPEAQVRRTVSEAAAAAEKKDWVALRTLVSDKYADSQGRDKKTVEGILRVYFLRNASLHL